MTPCKYTNCVSFCTEKSVFGYCYIHHQVATIEELYDKALKGQISAPLKEFALDLQRGLFPSNFKH